MITSYPYDPHVRRAVARLLYRLLPALYRVKDLGPSVPREDPSLPTYDAVNVRARFLRDLHELADDVTPPELPQQLPQGTADLYRLLHVLAAPLAVVRQNVDELHADLFIDRCQDAMLPLLAGQVGTQLVFKNPDDDRDDLRGTVVWRRRKGTRSMLEEMASTLLHRRVVTQEGWSQLLMSQQLNLVRAERGACNVRSPQLADTCAGPYDAAFHALDARRPTARTGRYHPRHVTHWTHATTLFPVHHGTAGTWPERFGGPDFDRRYTFHPAGVEAPLRVRVDFTPAPMPSAVPGAPIATYEAPTDRVPASLFAARPERYFDDGSGPSSKFSVRILGLPAAVASSQPPFRGASSRAAGAALYNDKVEVNLLRRGEGAWRPAVEVMVCRVPLTGAGNTSPDVASRENLGGVRIRAVGADQIWSSPPMGTGAAVAMLRLSAEGGGATHFPGATLAVSGMSPPARRASEDAELARMGFLRGALHVEVPATWVWSERWFYLSADGSLYDAQIFNEPVAPGHAVDTTVTHVGDVVSLPGPARSAGPGPAWPPALPQATDEPLGALPPPLGQGPVFVHAAPVLDADGAPAGGSMRLVFARAKRGEEMPEPFMRISWLGPSNPTQAATWEGLSPTGVLLATGAEVLERWRDIAEEGSDACGLWLECDAAGLALPPCEIAFTDAYGQAMLIHVPELHAETRLPGNPLPSTALAVSEPFEVMRDGSTRSFGGQIGRYAQGSVIPLREAATLRRRQVRGRRLCPWRNETSGSRLAATTTGWLDVDAEHGLFAMALGDAVPTYTASVAAWPPAAPVTVDWQDGFTDHIGARTDARGPELDTWVRPPTRIVSSTGKIRPGEPPDRIALPRYATLSAAFEAIAAGPAASGEVVEVVEIDDSATYEETTVVWPGRVTSLTVQAAELERPVIRAEALSVLVDSYDELTLRGLSFDAEHVDVPAAKKVSVQFCSSARGGRRWFFRTRLDGTTEIRISRCHLDSVELPFEGKLWIDRSVLHTSTESMSASGVAIDARTSRVQLDRCTVSKGEGGMDEHCVLAGVLEASEVLFTHPIAVADRFSGCVRYSRVAPGSETPQRFRVTEARPRFASLDRFDAAHLRLATDAPEAILHGAEDGGEIGAFHDTGLTRRAEGVLRRLMEFTPAGLITGVIRQD